MGRVKHRPKEGDKLKVSLPDIPNTKNNKNLTYHLKERGGSGMDPNN